MVQGEVATLAWFNEAFPRTGVRSKTAAPPRTTGQQLQDACVNAMALVDVDFREGIGKVGELVDTIIDWAASTSSTSTATGR